MSPFCEINITRMSQTVNQMSLKWHQSVPFSIVIIFEHRTIKSWCSIPEDEQRLSASPFEEYFWSDTNGICSPEEKFYKVDPRIFFGFSKIFEHLRTWRNNYCKSKIIFSILTIFRATKKLKLDPQKVPTFLKPWFKYYES